MSEERRIPVKKYPIVAKQVIMEREGCAYCQQSPGREKTSVKTEKCYHCGFGTMDKMRGLLMNAFEKTRIPMVLIERIRCDCVPPEDNPDKHYHLRDGTVYHMINVASFDSRAIADSVCYKCRKNFTFLGQLCDDHDLDFAIKAFNAIDQNQRDMFRPFPEKNKRLFDYYSYRCILSDLTEVIVPIYTDDAPEDLRNRGVVGLLLIGQMAVGAPTKWGEDMQNTWTDEQIAMQSSWTGEQKMKIEELRSEAWKQARSQDGENSTGGVFKDVQSALETCSKHITDYLEQMRNEIIGRETDFLHTYQSELIKAFLKPYPSESAYGAPTGRKKAEWLRARIKEMFEKIWVDFSLGQLQVFIPDLELKLMENSQVMQGETIGTSGGRKMVIDLTKLFPDASYEYSARDLIENGALFALNASSEVGNTQSLDEQNLAEENCELYAKVYGDGSEKSMFGVFLEWTTRPVRHESESPDHKDFFRALVGICSSEIMALIAQSRAERLAAFAEEVRHDLAHRMQTLASHNQSFKIDSENYFFSRTIDEADYERFTRQYLSANRELFETLDYMKEELDSANVFRMPKPTQIHAYNDVFFSLRHLYNAPWHPRNRGQKLVISPSDTYTGRLSADISMFRRIVTNLVDNAFKYAPALTNVYIVQAFNHQTREILFDIVNFGFGIEETLAETIFDHGVKGRSAAAGKGLGLYIAREFAQRNNGSLDIVSGVIPASGVEGDKICGGFVCDVNFTVYNDILACAKKSTNYAKLAELEIRLREKREIWSNPWASLKTQGVEETMPSPLAAVRELADKVGKPTPLATVLVDPDDGDSSQRVASDSTPSPGDLRAYAEHELYLIAFRLRLPTKDM